MSIHVALNHVTHYRYDRRVALGPQLVRLRPAPHSRTRILSYSLRVLPAQHFVNWQQDPQSNYLARIVVPEKTREFRIEVDLVAEMSVLNPFDFFLEPQAERFPFAYTREQLRELAPYLKKRRATRRFAAYLVQISREPMQTTNFLVALNQRLQVDIQYLIRMEPGVQTPEETLAKGSGSCRDSGWLLVQILRHLGLAARFVSGYLIQLKPDVKALDGPSGTEVDFTDLHAWCEVYLPGAGWIGFDPTSGLLAGEGHIPLACSPEPSSAAPISGAVEECEAEFEHTMKVERVWEVPRVTKPYTEPEWQAIEALGRSIDADLARHDVRLTQGGEPTFVSVDDRDGAEWNTEAMGPTKRKRAAALLARLKAHYAPLGLLHYGQGKWYPGEQLPRWSLNAYWRADGEPIWSNTALVADESVDYGATEIQALAFLQGVAERLDLAPKHIFPAFEDTLVLPVARAPAAVQRRSLRFKARGCAGTRTPAQAVCGRFEANCRARITRRARRRRDGLAERFLVPARPALLPYPRRLARRLSPAAGLPALGAAGRLSLDLSCGSGRAASAVAAVSAHPPPGCDVCRRCREPGCRRYQSRGRGRGRC